MKKFYGLLWLSLLIIQPVQCGFTLFDESSVIAVRGSGVFHNFSGPIESNISTGKLQLDFPTNLTGTPIIFNDGSYSNGIFNVVLTATYDPSMSFSIQMISPSTALFTTIGTMYEKIQVHGSNNVMEGLPLFGTPNAIQLSGASAVLKMDLQGPLNQNIVLASTLSLGGDLELEDNVTIGGAGSINFNDFNLVLGKKDLVWTNTLTMISASNLELNSANHLYGRWNFTGISDIVGNTFTLDLTNGGVINIARNSTLRMTNVILRGLGSGSIVFTDLTSQLELFNVTLDMDNNVTFTTGIIDAIGPVTVVTRSFFMNFTNRATLTVDRAKVLYDPLSFNDQNNITFQSRFANLGLLNGGSVEKVRSLIVSDYQIDTNTILDRDLVVTTLKRLMVNQSTSITGAGFGFAFALTSTAPKPSTSPIFYVAPGKQALFTNINLRSFPIQNNSLGAGYQILFGDLTTVQLGQNGTLTDTWMFQGQTVLDGGGNILKLGASGQILVRPGSSLLLNNITIQDVSGGQIRCVDNTGTISFGNILLNQDGNFTLSNGKFDVIGVTEFGGTSTFIYNGNRTCNITGFGTFCFDEGMAFSYDPRIANRDLIQMESVDATLCFHSASYGSSTTGMRLTNGTLIISGRCQQFNAGAKALSQGISFGNGNPIHDLTIRYLAQGELDIQSGVFVYNNQQ